MASCSLAMIAALLLLAPVNANVEPLPCCPEDDQHIFLYMYKACNASSTLGLPCRNESRVIALLLGHDAVWLREDDGSIVIGSTVIGTVLAHGSFCAAGMTLEFNNTNETTWKVQKGIVYCEETPFHSTYLGPEPLSYAICILISAVGCFLTLVTYMVVPALRKDLLSKCLICALLCFTFMYLMIGITTFEAHQLPHRYCAYQVYFMFFCIIASIFWTNVISFDIWRSVVFRRFPLSETQLLNLYYFWGFGIPLLFSLIGLLSHNPNLDDIEEDECYINPVFVFGLYVVPSLALLFCNLLYFIWTICKLWRQDPPNNQGPNTTRLRRLRYKCFLYLKLFLIMGIPWIIRIIAAYLPGNAFTRILLNILSILQGLFVFLLLVVFRKKALLGLAGQFAKWGCPCPFITTNFAVTLHDEDDDEDDDRDRVNHDVVELNTQTTPTS